MRWFYNLYYSRYKLFQIQWHQGVEIRSYWNLKRIHVYKHGIYIPIRFVKDSTLETALLLNQEIRKCLLLRIKK